MQYLELQSYDSDGHTVQYSIEHNGRNGYAAPVQNSGVWTCRRTKTVQILKITI